MFSALLFSFFLLLLSTTCARKLDEAHQREVDAIIDSYVDVEHAMELMAEIAKENYEEEVSAARVGDPEEMHSKGTIGRVKVPKKIKSFAKAWCHCDKLRGCPCQTQNGTDLVVFVEKLLTKLKRSPGYFEHHINDTAKLSSIHRLAQKIRDFFRNGFRRLKETFTRRTVDSKYHHTHVSVKHHHSIGIPRLRFFVKGIFIASQKQQAGANQ